MDIKNTITSIAIGGFDGMHLAHQQLFSKLDKNGAIIVIQTSYANLSPHTNRDEHTLYPIFFYPLENIKHLSGEEFIKLLYQEFPLLKKIVVGYDFHFGYKAAYSTENLKLLFKGVVEVIDEYKIDNIAVHSRVIRSYLRDGDIKLANNFLGYNYKLKGYHISGQGIGKKQFVPTINLDVKEFLIPQEGIYATKTILNNISYNSVTFIGHRVTTDGKFAVETHILENIEEINIPKVIEVKFYQKLRENKKFDSYEILKDQILLDIEQTKNYFIS
ncbi:MAG: bifunctional riboflavin kinase/FAD synthetase [Campylobacterota bacterium]|nr:bifunctional riboflavin kinase/FAD synthetase [Campylobacterota bacterium]